MSALNPARAFSAPFLVAVLLLGSLGASAMTTWNDGAADFPSGQLVNTRVEGGALALAPDPSLPGNWTKRSDLSSPPPRYQHSMVYDPAGGVHLLFGGYYGTYYRNDTWAYAAGSNRWTAFSPIVSPAPRTGHAMAFDAQSGAAVMFGGMDAGGIPASTWAFNYTSGLWNDRAPATAPNGRAFPSMVYVPAIDRSVLFGGRLYLGGAQYLYYGDTWTYDYDNNSWTNRSSGAAPGPRYGAVMGYDPLSGLVFLFGGRNETECFQDSWTYDPALNAWTSRNPPTRPPARSGAAMVFDPDSGNFVLFGGQGSSASYNDTWTYSPSGNSWTSRLGAAGPTPRLSLAMSYDPGTKTTMLFGGREQGGEYQDDLWGYDQAKNLWTLRGQLSSPVPRTGCSAAYDPVAGLGVLFSGTDTTYTYNDTWTYDAGANLWTHRRPALSPSPRHHAAMAYDSSAGVMVLFGGTRDSTELDDTWTYSLSTNSWTNRQPASGPPAGGCYCLADDPVHDLIFLFGGHSLFGLGNETWSYNMADNVWTNRTGGAAPTARKDFDMVFDSASASLVLFGGQDAAGPLADTWTLVLPSSTWGRMSPAVSPPARSGHAMAQDTGKGAVMLFGGVGAGSSLLGDTWSYNASADTWTALTPAIRPSPRMSHRMFHDAGTNALILFGGWDGASRGDTWALGLSGRQGFGTYTSPSRDAGGSAYFGSLGWVSVLPAGTGIGFQLRTGASLADLESRAFLGPDGTGSSCYTASGQSVNPVHNGSRWLQYRAYLSSGDLRSTPTISSVTVSFNLLQSLAVTSPAGGESWTGLHSINWSSSDPENDDLLIDIYLLNGTESKPLAENIPAGYGSWTWDTRYEPNGTYRLMLVSRDENAQIPLSVNSTSGEFELRHSGPPPIINHPPDLWLDSPMDGAALNTRDVRLQWTGSDRDIFDPLQYYVYFSNTGFNLSALPAPVAVTNRSLHNTSNLTDGATYWWTVRATDGKANTTAPVRSFTIRLGSVNLPPRFTSSPPTNATVGVGYVYNATAVDDDGGNITFRLATPVEGMTINASTGRLDWTPKASQRGNVPVTINISDGQGGYAEQSFTVNVRDAPLRPPSVTIEYPRQGQMMSGFFKMRGTADNGSYKLILVQARIDGRDWRVIALAAGNWSLEVDSKLLLNGRHLVEVRAFDGRQYSPTAALELQVRNPEKFDQQELPVGYIMLALAVAAALVLLYPTVLKKLPIEETGKEEGSAGVEESQPAQSAGAAGHR